MPEQHQQQTVDFLASGRAFADPGETVELKQTHISRIFIGREKVFKLKRAVKLPYLDFSTISDRKKACRAEVEINSRTAPGIYLGVRAVTRREDGSLVIDGDGEVVDWLVEMRRFDENMLFDRMLARGEITRSMTENLAEEIATFHAGAMARTDGGGRAGIAMVIEGNARAFYQNPIPQIGRGSISELTERSIAVLDDIAPLLDQRREGGCVRFCHGDLHLGNIVMDDGRPVLFDAIEFDEQLNKIDVLYDLAFLLMDLEHAGRGDLASIALNHYMDITGSAWGVITLPLFLSLRAAIRSHVAATLAAAGGPGSDEKGAEARGYMEMALAYLSPPPPRLVAIGGLSGSGKSRAARSIASMLGVHPGARVVRSDVLRKRIAGVHPLDRLGDDGYTPEMTERTYAQVYDETRAVLLAGHTVIADCVFARPEQRRAIEDVAIETGVPFDGLWLEADAETMKQRVGARIANASDADARVVESQLGYDLGEISWTRIDSSGAREKTDQLCMGALGGN